MFYSNENLWKKFLNYSEKKRLHLIYVILYTYIFHEIHESLCALTLSLYFNEKYRRECAVM